MGQTVAVRGPLRLLQGNCYTPGCLGIVRGPALEALLWTHGSMVDGHHPLDDVAPGDFTPLECCGACSGLLGMRTRDDARGWSLVLRSGAAPPGRPGTADARFDCGGDGARVCCPIATEGEMVVSGVLAPDPRGTPHTLLLANTTICRVP